MFFWAHLMWLSLLASQLFHYRLIDFFFRIWVGFVQQVGFFNLYEEPLSNSLIIIDPYIPNRLQLELSLGKSLTSTARWSRSFQSKTSDWSSIGTDVVHWSMDLTYSQTLMHITKKHKRWVGTRKKGISRSRTAPDLGQYSSDKLNLQK